jgi:hypothetical protein
VRPLRVALIAALGALAAAYVYLAGMGLGDSEPLAAGIVDLGACGPYNYAYNATGAMGLLYLANASFYSYGPSRSNSIGIQLNVYIAGGGGAYWAQDVLILSRINGTYYLAAADYLYNLSDLSSLSVKGHGGVVEEAHGGRVIRLYQFSATAGPLDLPATLGARIFINGSAVYFSYMVDGAWRVYDVVQLPEGAYSISVGQELYGRRADLEWVVVGPQEGYAAYIERWSGWAQLFYYYGGWRQPPCAYSAAQAPSTAESTDAAHGLAEYLTPSGEVAQAAGPTELALLWRPSLEVEPAAGAIVITAYPPLGDWHIYVNGTPIEAPGFPVEVPAGPGVYYIRAELYAGSAEVYKADYLVTVPG